jgi:hypothetical protein
MVRLRPRSHLPWALLALGLLASVALAIAAPGAALQAWLVNVAFVLALALGALLLDAMLGLGDSDLGRQWHWRTARATHALPLGALAWLPIAYGLPWLYPGAAPAPRLARAAVYFYIWIGAGRLLDRRRDSAWLASVLLALVASATLAAIDWLMALTPHYASAGYGLRWCVGALVAAAAALSVLQWHDARAGRDVPLQQRFDAANLLLAATLGWLYLLFTDYLTAWSGNLPDEAAWWLPRLHGGWLAASIALVAVHAASAALLLSRRLKRKPALLGAIALALLAAQWLQSLWLVLPGQHASAIVWPTLAATALLLLMAALQWLRHRPRLHWRKAASHG